MNQTIDILTIVNITYEAGQKILEIYHNHSVHVEWKNDESPLTIADKQSHHYICEQLLNNYPNIPLISEEGDLLDYEQRKHWHTAWLVDPLDGTKEFIKRNGEFTVNIGLIENATPVLGVIYVPVQDTMYVAYKKIGSYKLTHCSEKLHTIHNEADLLVASYKLPLQHTKESFHIAVSRSHFSDETEHFINQVKQRHTNVQTIASGSSIKMCLVAEGIADVYPRLSYSMEWDTAAGEAIVKYSGGSVLDYETNKPMQYNKPNLKNPFHICTSQPQQ